MCDALRVKCTGGRVIACTVAGLPGAGIVERGIEVVVGGVEVVLGEVEVVEGGVEVVIGGVEVVEGGVEVVEERVEKRTYPTLSLHPTPSLHTLFYV